MIKVKRLRHVSFASPNVEAQLDYYQSIIGLAVIGAGRPPDYSRNGFR